AAGGETARAVAVDLSSAIAGRLRSDIVKREEMEPWNHLRGLRIRRIPTTVGVSPPGYVRSMSAFIIAYALIPIFSRTYIVIMSSCFDTKSEVHNFFNFFVTQAYKFNRPHPIIGHRLITYCLNLIRYGSQFAQDARLCLKNTGQKPVAPPCQSARMPYAITHKSNIGC